MIFHIATSLLMLCCTSVFSQENHDHFTCSYYGETVTGDIRMSGAEPSAEEVIQGILAVVGLRPNFEIRAANLPNAAAVILNKKRYILYNSKFMADINSASGTDWAGISILAHEIGHHLNGHTLTGQGSRPDLELEADEFSGFILAKLGASLADAQAAMAVAASQKASHTHPAKRDRLVAIAGGWNNAKNQSGETVASKTNKNIEKPADVRSTETNESAIASRYIAFNVHFDADRSGQYYITTKGNLVNVADKSLYIIGRLAESNRRDYKLMLSDKNYNYLYIGKKGDIRNATGRKVGYIEQR